MNARDSNLYSLDAELSNSPGYIYIVHDVIIASGIYFLVRVVYYQILCYAIFEL